MRLPKVGDRVVRRSFRAYSIDNPLLATNPNKWRWEAGTIMRVTEDRCVVRWDERSPRPTNDLHMVGALAFLDSAGRILPFDNPRTNE